MKTASTLPAGLQFYSHITQEILMSNEDSNTWKGFNEWCSFSHSTIESSPAEGHGR